MNGVVQIANLGSFGRFGNQLFQYAAARGYARKIGARLETPPWVGEYLFKGINAARITSVMPTLPLDTIPQNGETNINLHGYFQHSQAFELYTLADLVEWFTFKDHVKEHLARYEGVGVVAHLRRGDYLHYPDAFCTIHKSAYETAIAENGYDVSKVEWVCEENPRDVGLLNIPWLADFAVLLNAQVLFRSNSTFSWWAALLWNHYKVYSPVVEGKFGQWSDVKFIEGNWPRCTDQPSVHNYHIK